MLAVVALDPAAVPPGEVDRVVAVLAGFVRRHECVLVCTERTVGATQGMLAALSRVLPRFRFVPLLAGPATSRRAVDPALLAGLLDDGAVPVAVGGDEPAVPLAEAVAAAVGANTVLRLADTPTGTTLQAVEWAPLEPAA